jgi:hypothetical protein
VALAGKSNGSSGDDEEAARIERAIGRIGKVLGQEASLESARQELAGMIEAMRENSEIIKACIAKEKVEGDGEVIRDQIRI